MMIDGDRLEVIKKEADNGWNENSPWIGHIDWLIQEVDKLRDITGEGKTMEQLREELAEQGIDVDKAHKKLMNILDLKIEIDILTKDRDELKGFVRQRSNELTESNERLRKKIAENAELKKVIE